MTPIKISTIRIGMCQWTLADNELISVIAYDLIPRHDENAIYYNECCFAEYYIWVLIQILRDASNKQIHSRFVFTCNQLNIYVRIDITGTYGSEYMCKFDNGTTSITNYVNDSQWVFKSSPYGGASTLITTVEEYINIHLLDKIDTQTDDDMHIGRPDKF